MPDDPEMVCMEGGVMSDHQSLNPIFAEIQQERRRQDAKWAKTKDEDLGIMMLVLMEEVGEVAHAVLATAGRDTIKWELIQVAAVAVAMLEGLAKE